jgi:colanic acid/amylovoran biosynthesis glycosyltransferase
VNKVIIAHAMISYLRQSETFIWQYLHKFKNTHPIIFADSLQNLEQFPITTCKYFTTYGPRWTWLWFLNNWYRRILKQPYGHMAKIMRGESVQIIHAHFGPIGCSYLPLSVSLNIPLITNFYGYDLFEKDVLDQYHQTYQALFNTGHLFLVEGPNMRGKLVSLGCPREKISIQRIAIDLDQYTFKERVWDERRPIRLLFVGRFVEKKGLEYAFRALAKIRKDYLFEFRIIGKGILEDNLRLLAANLGFTSEIVWLGVEPHKRVIEELKTCDILIQPSVTAKNGDSEGGAPTIILEAQACGVPIIATEHADIPYIVHARESAILSHEKDVEGLANNIIYLFNNSHVWSEMGKKGREHVEKSHNIEKEVVVLENLYQKIVYKT